MLGNLVENAGRHRPDGLALTIACGNGPGGAAWFEVRDNGPGVPEADRARIFERFYRADKSRSRASGGAGLGLAIAKSVLGRMNGSIEYGVREGFGATFVVALPRGQ